MNALLSEGAVSSAPSEITRLLRRWGAGDSQALDQPMPIVYDRLRPLAHARLRAEGRACSLDTTALVHEAYLKLVDSPNPSLRDRSHFLGLASRVMRHLLVDHARARNAAKRGGRRKWPASPSRRGPCSAAGTSARRPPPTWPSRGATPRAPSGSSGRFPTRYA